MLGRYVHSFGQYIVAYTTLIDKDITEKFEDARVEIGRRKS